MTDSQSQDAGASAWGGKPLSPTPKASIRKDLPDPASNTSPKAPVPVDTYYKKYNDMMARANGKDTEPSKTSIETQENPTETDTDDSKKHLRELIEAGEGLYLNEIPIDFVLSDRAFRPLGIKAKNGKPIFEVISAGKVIGLAVRDGEPPKYQL